MGGYADLQFSCMGLGEGGGENRGSTGASPVAA